MRLAPAFVQLQQRGRYACAAVHLCRYVANFGWWCDRLLCQPEFVSTPCEHSIAIASMMVIKIYRHKGSLLR